MYSVGASLLPARVVSCAGLGGRRSSCCVSWVPWFVQGHKNSTSTGWLPMCFTTAVAADLQCTRHEKVCDC